MTEQLHCSCCGKNTPQLIACGNGQLCTECVLAAVSELVRLSPELVDAVSDRIDDVLVERLNAQPFYRFIR